MPELPEVETVRADLQAILVGRRISSVVAAPGRCMRVAGGEAELGAGLIGATVTAVGRRGKHLLFEVAGETGADRVLVVHLGMSGWLWWLQGDSVGTSPKHTHLLLGFGDRAELAYVDPRTFGWFTLVDAADLHRRLPVLARLGPEPLADSFTAAKLAAMLAGRPTKIKALLLDQGFIAGIGNIYSDEMLYRARLRWDRPASSLSPDEVKRLHRAMRSVLRQAIAARGSTLSDSQYRDVEGAQGGFQQSHAVYAREGLPCESCGGPVSRARLGGRSTFFCPRCQL